MRAAFGMAGLLIVLVIGYLIYSSQIGEVSGDKPFAHQANSVAVQRDLLSLGQAEKLYLATNGSYATLEDLRNSSVMSSIPDGSRLGYAYSVEVDGKAHFRITASSSSPSRNDLPTLSINETMLISR
jgi:hypothetical protein